MSARKDAKFYERSSDCVEDVKDGAKVLIGGTVVVCFTVLWVGELEFDYVQKCML